MLQHNYNANVSDDVTLVCSAVVDPPPEVTWYHRGNHSRVNTKDQRRRFKLVPSKRERWNATMTIQNINLGDHESSYYCRMKNKLGVSQSAAMNVLVNRKYFSDFLE